MPSAPARVLPYLGDVQDVLVEATLDTGTWVGSGTSYPVQLLSGSVTDDRGQRWRRSLTAVVHPDVDRALLEPWGTRLTVRQGIRLPDGQTAWAGLIVARLQTCRRSEDSVGWAVTGRSLESAVVDDVYDGPTTLQHDSAIQLITDVITESVPDAKVVVDSRVVDARVPAVVHEDRWDAIRGKQESIATALGADVFCAGDGVFRIAPATQLGDDPTETVASGSALVSFDEEVTREGIPNRVIAYSDRLGSDAPAAYGVWEDVLPGSKTRRSGPFGRVTLKFPNPVLTSNSQAENAARTRGLALQGLRASVDLSAVHNPWRAAGDLVTVIDRDGRRQLFVLDRVTTRIGGGAQSASARTREG